MCRTRQSSYIETDKIVDLKIDQLFIVIGGDNSSESEDCSYSSREDELSKFYLFAELAWSKKLRIRT